MRGNAAIMSTERGTLSNTTSVATDIVVSGTTSAADGRVVSVSLNDKTYSASASAGTWTVTGLAAETYTLTVNGANGAFTAVPTVAGCSSSGTLTPRSSGKDVFNVSLTTGGAPCLVQNETSTGIALAYDGLVIDL